jgi:hypothetical protein
MYTNLALAKWQVPSWCSPAVPLVQQPLEYGILCMLLEWMDLHCMLYGSTCKKLYCSQERSQNMFTRCSQKVARCRKTVHKNEHFCDGFVKSHVDAVQVS